LESHVISPGFTARPSRAMVTVAAVLAGAITVTGLTWAKWDPYAHKLVKLWHTRAWSGPSVLASAGKPAASPSWHGAWSFTVTYGKSVWIALVAALLISAAVDSLLPRERVVKLLAGHSPMAGSFTAGVLAMPCMMCTCCSAPLAATLRRRGVPTGSVLSYWLGNPVLNPAVLVFLALVAPWQWVLTRAIAGAALVFGVTMLLSRIAARRSWPEPPPDPRLPLDMRKAPARFVKTLGRLSISLVPEYFVVVFALGAFRGWLFPLGANAAHWGLLAVIVAAVAGTLVVIPTAGEIPILQGLAALGLGAAPLGVLLLTLPAVSLPSMVMVGRALTWRIVALTGTAVAVTGIASGALLWALS
jgi:uncharacterized protein